MLLLGHRGLLLILRRMHWLVVVLHPIVLLLGTDDRAGWGQLRQRTLMR